MKKITTSNFAFIYTLVLFFGIQSAYSQLTAFSLTVTKTDETCTGNGTLTFSVSGTTAGSTIFYSVYLQPDITTPVSVVNIPTLGGLAHGNYHVLATQSLGALSNTDEFDIEILDTRSALEFTLDGHAINCITGEITVDVSQGTVATYEISAGPVIVAPQTSNVFTNLPLGQYTIKVTDVCHDVVVRDFTLVYVFNPTDLEIGANPTVNCNLTTCNSKDVIYRISVPVGSNILYPYQVQLTVFPPNGGTPIILNQTVSSGNPTSQAIPFTIPYYNATYTTNIRFTDLCGNVVEQNGISISGVHEMTLGQQSPASCHKQLGVGTCNLMPPFMIAFISAPPGFNPTTHNPLGLGPFTSGILYDYNATTQTELPSGEYDVQITDACGVVIEHTIVIKPSVTDYDIELPRYYDGCVLPNYLHIPSEGVPINTAVITEAPTGYNHTIPHDVTSLIESHLLEMTLTVPGLYIYEGINICGDPYVVRVTVRVPNIKPYITPDNITGCINYHGSISLGYEIGNIEDIYYEEGPEIASVTITQAPAEFLHTLPYDASSFIIPNQSFPHKNTVAMIPDLPVGDYTLFFTDVCGTIYGPFTVNVPLKLLLTVNASVLEGCEIGYGSVRLNNGGSFNERFLTVIMTSAPATSPFAALLPYDVSFNIAASGSLSFSMNGLPEGNYSFYTKDACGIENNTPVNIGNHFYDSSADFEGHCGSFNLFIHHPPPTGSPTYYVLQKWNPLINFWVHPLTGYLFQPGSYPNSANSYILQDNNYNITAQGTFRVLKLSYMYGNGTDEIIPCINTLSEFEFLGTLKITDAYKISCVSGSSQVFIIAGDTDPLHYYITQKDGQPFAVDNNNSNVFNSLAPGIYNFLVRDLCGNEVNRLFDVTALAEPVVTPSDLCDGMSGQLSIPPFSFLSYQWWNGNDPTTILSTSNVLHFNPFSIATTPGTYFVRAYSTSVLSCLDTTISYVIAPAIDPHAGDDNELIICSRGSVNLNTLLGGQFDANGIWTETTTSGMLNGHTWLPINLGSGAYEFKYTVNGFCGQLDEAIITINLLGTLPAPVVTMNDVTCFGNDVNLYVADIAGVNFAWTGPNNFTSSEQNPTITNSTLANNGVYTVRASANGCNSNANITVNLVPGPDFRMTAACVNGVYTVTAVPNDDSLDNATYLWTGPGNFTSNQNPVPIAGLSPGMYGVTVVSPEGCKVTDEIRVNTTVCEIPNVITPNDDLTNDVLDLTQFDVRRIEIYSRWGRLVYDQNNYTNQWHGQNNKDELLPDSTYYYILYLGSGEEKQGWVFVNGNN